MSMDKGVPEIRFEGYKEKWNIEQFKSLTKINQGLQIEISSRYTHKVDNSYFYITNEFLKDGSDYQYYIVNPPASVLCNPDDVLMTRTGNTGHVVTNISGAFHNNFFKINFNRKVLDKNFLVHYLKWDKTQQTILRVAGSSTIPDLNHDDFYNIEIAYSKTEEQTQIGSYFQKLDSLINQHQQKHDKLSSIKKAMLEKMFPKQGKTIPEIRFKGFGGEWEEKELGTDIAEIIGGGTPSTSISEFWDGDIDWYSPTEIGSNVYAEGSQKKITALGLKSSSAKILPAGNTVLFTSRAGIGDMAILAKSGATNQGFQSFIVKEGFSPYFLYSAGKLIKEFALKHASGSTFLEISGKQLGRMKILIPNSDEQIAIGNYFQKLDTLISQHQQQVTKLNNIKQACLNKMFV